MNIRQQIVLRVRLAFLLVLLFSIAIVWKISNIQFVQGDKWIKMAEEINLQYMKVPATRGNIFSNNGSLLATSLPFFKVAFDPGVVERDVFRNGIDSLSWLLSRFYKDRSAAEYKRKILDARSDGKRFITLNRRMISYQEMKLMRNWPIFREGRMKGGAIFEKVDKRFKPFSSLALRTIGFMNEQREGAGLEYSFNQQLAGTDGEALFRKMAGGAWKPLHDENEVTPEQGLDIETTIDVNLQDVAEASLENHLRAHGADYGCVVLMEVATGEIKAI
ncbi:MAG: cell division protein, partial [Cytophagales bacterium]|nr:cell division protein [Cytophagales bacterium]